MAARTIPAALALALAGLALASMVKPEAATAAPYWPWCSLYFGSGIKTCAFATFDQCLETVRGIGGLCQSNPKAPPLAPPRRHAEKRHVPGA